MNRFVLLVAALLAGCDGSPAADQPGLPSQQAATEAKQVLIYRSCDFGRPGELVPLPRQVSAAADPVEAAVRELVRGVTSAERARGCSSFFTSRSQDALISLNRSATGDTIMVDFRHFADLIDEQPGSKSFLPPGVMAELTWTLFHQFEEIEAVRFSFNGDPRAFWTWVAGEASEPQVYYTRRMWERI